MALTSAASERRGGQGPAATPAVTPRVLCWITATFLGLHAVTARAASDWIDELPTVTTVAHAVTEQLKVDTVDWRFDMRGIALKDDDDLFAVYLVGTLVLLRKLILYKDQEEKSLSREREANPDREAKLQFMVAAYLEAELLIGQAVGNRRGYLTTAQKCRDIGCYRRWFKTGYSNVYIGAAYRARILPRLFPCGDRAAELDRLAQSNAKQAAFLPSPAETSTIQPELQGVAPAGCCVYGGDANRNGLCDDWQSPPPTTPRGNAGASACSASGECSRPKQPLFLNGQLACEQCENEWIEVRRGVSARQPSNTAKPTEVTFQNCKGQTETRKTNPPELDDGISIRVKCAQGHVVQFISREDRLTNGKLESGQYGLGQDPANPGNQACFDKTDDDKDLEKRKWRTDSKWPDPYYESTGAYITSCDSMTTIDAPSFQFDPQYKEMRAVAKSFAVCDGKVVSVVDWWREFIAGSACPSYHVEPPRTPTLDEIEKFRKLSSSEKPSPEKEGFRPWP
jgi:hypothetical protein